jgi:hypothetical protein
LTLLDAYIVSKHFIQMPDPNTLHFPSIVLDFVWSAMLLLILHRHHSLGPPKVSQATGRRWAILLPLIGYAFVALITWFAISITPGFSFFSISGLLIGLTCATGLTITAVLVLFSIELNARYGNRWVKALDFPYLFFGGIGLLRVVNSSPFIETHMSALDAAGLVSLALALSIRLAKAIIETFFDDWAYAPQPPQPSKRQRAKT